MFLNTDIAEESFFSSFAMCQGKKKKKGQNENLIISADDMQLCPLSTT